MRFGIAVVAALALLVVACGGHAATPGDKDVPPALNFTMKTIDGKEVALSKYQGNVILVVNVASKCGLTPQYKQLQALYEKYKDKGLVVIGVPANEFGGQEPGSNEEISQFCTSKYHVTFPMMSKVVVKGDGICPLYQYLTAQNTKPAPSGPITWNFEKFVISREGNVVARFSPRVKPDSPDVLKVIESELAKK
jgi:glutathione peroxidase